MFIIADKIFTDKKAVYFAGIEILAIKLPRQSGKVNAPSTAIF